ncbi:WAT1-related protein isoform X2 [Gossypium australe]|uniref:WAT1-related protein isoform X2 n=1 Tax=Gossypium australe TaxID=47621 RepID=A0A5B6X2Y6_9ROSI|nr:WAT1-related protein isoform X2 [Gossypium australe]
MNEPLCPCCLLKCSSSSHSSSNSFFLHKVLIYLSIKSMDEQLMDFFIYKKKQPPITLSFLCKIFCLSIAGITLMQNYVIIGVRYNSPTLASALANLILAFTFLLVVIFKFVSATMPFVFVV